VEEPPPTSTQSSSPLTGHTPVAGHARITGLIVSVGSCVARTEMTRTLFRIDRDAPFRNTIPESRCQLRSGSCVACARTRMTCPPVDGSVALNVTAELTRRPFPAFPAPVPIVHSAESNAVPGVHSYLRRYPAGTVGGTNAPGVPVAPR
jgi:hypothetical protein